jgi:hypothetical protein
MVPRAYGPLSMNFFDNLELKNQLWIIIDENHLLWMKTTWIDPLSIKCEWIGNETFVYLAHYPRNLFATIYYKWKIITSKLSLIITFVQLHVQLRQVLVLWMDDFGGWISSITSKISKMILYYLIFNHKYPNKCLKDCMFLIYISKA